MWQKFKKVAMFTLAECTVLPHTVGAARHVEANDDRVLAQEPVFLQWLSARVSVRI